MIYPSSLKAVLDLYGKIRDNVSDPESTKAKNTYTIGYQVEEELLSALQEYVLKSIDPLDLYGVKCLKNDGLILAGVLYLIVRDAAGEYDQVGANCSHTCVQN